MTLNSQAIIAIQWLDEAASKLWGLRRHSTVIYMIVYSVIMRHIAFIMIG